MTPNKISILLLEDSQEDAFLINRTLLSNKKDCHIRVVDDRPGFVSELFKSKPDLILADYNLPTFSGFQALEIARLDYPEIPFVFVTGAIGEEIAAETVLNGAAGLVLKSNLKKLPGVVERAIETKQFLYDQRIKDLSNRINAQVSANIKILERIKMFLDNGVNEIDESERAKASSALDSLMQLGEGLN